MALGPSMDHYMCYYVCIIKKGGNITHTIYWIPSPHTNTHNYPFSFKSSIENTTKAEIELTQ